MSANLTPAGGPATELIAQIEAQGFVSHGKPLTRFAPWQRLKRTVMQMEAAVNHCWRIVVEVRQQITAMSSQRKGARTVASGNQSAPSPR